MATATEWQEQIEQVCANVGIHQVDLLLDQTAWDNCAVPALQTLRPQIPWFSLFTGMPEENLLEQAPLLMRLDLTHWQHKAWLEELMTHCAADARLLVLVSPLPFDALSRALQLLSQMTWGGQSGLLRYYDPRVFPLLVSSILSSEQLSEYLRVACYWGWLDRDNQPQWLQGIDQTQQNSPNVNGCLELSDQQCSLIGCISDAQRMLDGGNFDHLEKNQELRFARLYAFVVQASQENYFGDLTEYVRQKL